MNEFQFEQKKFFIINIKVNGVDDDDVWKKLKSFFKNEEELKDTFSK